LDYYQGQEILNFHRRGAEDAEQNIPFRESGDADSVKASGLRREISSKDGRFLFVGISRQTK